MTEQEKQLWLEAIGKLGEHYKKYELDQIPPSYRRGTGKLCPLCEADNNIKRPGIKTCESCLWPKFEDGYCGSKNWARHLTLQRLDRLDRWERLIKEMK